MNSDCEISKIIWYQYWVRNLEFSDGKSTFWLLRRRNRIFEVPGSFDRILNSFFGILIKIFDISSPRIHPIYELQKNYRISVDHSKCLWMCFKWFLMILRIFEHNNYFHQMHFIVIKYLFKTWRVIFIFLTYHMWYNIFFHA